MANLNKNIVNPIKFIEIDHNMVKNDDQGFKYHNEAYYYFNR